MVVDAVNYKAVLILMSGASYTVTSLAVVIAIVRRYLKTRYPMGLLVAVSLALQGLVYAVAFEGNEWLLKFHPALNEEWQQALNRVFRLAACNSLVLALLIFGYFTYRTFRPGKTWALLLLAATGLCLFLSKDLTLMVEGPLVSTPWLARRWILAFYVIGSDLICVWMAWESLRAWRRFREDVRAGEQRDPVVINRFLLWGLAAVTYAVTGVSNLFARPQTAIELQPLWIVLLKSAGIFIFAILGYLSWAPSERFKAWITRRSQAV